MSKMGQFVLSMEEDVTWMDKETFVKEYGHMGETYWEEIYGEDILTANESHALMMLEHMEVMSGRY